MLNVENYETPKDIKKKIKITILTVNIITTKHFGVFSLTRAHI